MANFKDLRNVVAESTGMTKTLSDRAVHAVVEGIQELLVRDGEVKLTGFGTFRATKRAPRKAYNFATKTTVEVPATTVPTFKAGKGLKEAVK